MNIKKGQFLSPWDMKNVVDKAQATGNEQIMVCERGASFGYNNLVSDMRSLAVMRETGCPVVFDATHSVQLPGGAGGKSGGQREFVPVLSRAAVAVGIAGIFMETHPDPDKALSDGPNAWPLGKMAALLETLLALDRDPTKTAAGSAREPIPSYIQTTDPMTQRSPSVHAREILDSRGNPTLEADVTLSDGSRRPRGGAERRLDRLARSGRAARWRQDALSRQGREEGRRQRQRHDRATR